MPQHKHAKKRRSV